MSADIEPVNLTQNVLIAPPAVVVEKANATYSQTQHRNTNIPQNKQNIFISL